jgi:superfamily II DNA/RNA helicase
MEKQDREESFMNFKNGKFRVLISSSILARGIDLQQVNMVINYDIPRSTETYLHAIGRSGRYGRRGAAINFVTKHDVSQLRRIEDHYKISIKEFNRELVCGKSK